MIDMRATQRQIGSFASPGGKMKIKVILDPSKEGGFTVYAPSLPGCISEGNSEEEALSNIKEAIELYLEPVDDELFVSGSQLVKEVAL